MGWGAKAMGRLADDLHREIFDMNGLSRSNLFYMRAFAEACSNEEIVQQLVGLIPWWYDVVIMIRIKDPQPQERNLQACIGSGSSRAVLVAQIEPNEEANGCCRPGPAWRRLLRQLESGNRPPLCRGRGRRRKRRQTSL